MKAISDSRFAIRDSRFGVGGPNPRIANPESLTPKQADDPLQPRPIIVVERIQPIRIDVEHRDQFPRVVEHGHDDLRLRIWIAGDVAGERVDVGHDDRLAPLRGRAADAAAELDLQAADGADVRADDEVVAADAVEAGPEKGLEAMREYGVDRGHERDVVERLAAFVAPDGGDRVVALVVRRSLHARALR